jgi:hypothetical protein
MGEFMRSLDDAVHDASLSRAAWDEQIAGLT